MKPPGDVRRGADAPGATAPNDFCPGNPLHTILAMTKPGRDGLLVFISHRDSTCGECDENLGRKAWIQLREGPGAVCLSCADLDQLDYLPAGDSALTRRARKYSTLSAVVLEWSGSRKRYERQGLLVEPAALERAESECRSDAEVRAARRLRSADRRAEEDAEFVAAFAARVREEYPRCPEGRERTIAEHACRKYSGRVGRSASAKRLDADAVRLAVQAHVRHTETDYDDLLADGLDRHSAREEVQGAVRTVLAKWCGSIQ